MNINTLFLTKFKCLFNKNYQKMISNSELKDGRKDAGRNILYKINSLSMLQDFLHLSFNLKLPAYSLWPSQQY